MTVYGYVRVSTDRQADEGVSLSAQERTLAGYALMQGLQLEQTFVEQGVSGATPLALRSEGSRLLTTLRPGDVVLTPKLDRMFRSALDALRVLERLHAEKIGLHMLDLGGDVTGNGISKLVFTILSAVAEAERDRIRERIVEVKRDQRRQGRYLGGIVPFGYRRGADGELIADAAEQVIVRHAQALRQEGQPLRAIQASVAAAFQRRLSLDALSRMVQKHAE